MSRELKLPVSKLPKDLLRSWEAYHAEFPENGTPGYFRQHLFFGPTTRLRSKVIDGEWMCDYLGIFDFPVADLPDNLFEDWEKMREEFPTLGIGEEDPLSFGHGLDAIQNDDGAWVCNYPDVCTCDVWINGCTCGVFKREQANKSSS